MTRAAFSSYPYRFAVGQVGQVGQSPETRMNRAFRVSNLHIYSGTGLGHSGTLRYQDVAGRAFCRARALPGPPLPAEKQGDSDQLRNLD